MAEISCDYLILGSGISGMSMALFLAQTGADVLVLEKSPVPGGAMQRFRRNGIPLDTGFHFTGGIPGCFGEMLRIAGLDEAVETIPIRMRLFFTRSGHTLALPRGHRAAEEYLAARYPDDAANIHAYFELEREIIRTTPLFNLRKDFLLFEPAPENADIITLADAMDRFGFRGELRAALESSVTCHGTPPSEIALSGHCRVNYGLLNELTRVRGGGAAIVDAFLRQTGPGTGIRLKTDCTVAQFGGITDGGKCREAVLTDGTKVKFENCVMTLHPREILRLLPQEKVRPELRERVDSFEESCGFFTVHFRIDNEVPDFREELLSVFNTEDVESAILARNGAFATGMMMTEETVSDGRRCRCLTAFQSVAASETKEWEDSRTGHRSESYQEYKREKSRRIADLVRFSCPQFEGKMEILSSSSMLTYRDYLSPYGSAYGIRQKTGQHNLFGRLPVRNFYVCGQNSMLPGAFGAMLSSIHLFRKLAGEDVYTSLLDRRLGKENA
ncbi:MAG: NAD(P)/FAD-dependent oxidoreductase [Lentisphaeria bacterium]|nr:NAD(P)/FAD-dependent oxidoreductase [Lentisphaeria bacterium]